jgi:3-deoxy-D-manno-octulosonate 8-phosphate phosphatase (KDO 8-P phosphatase)
MGEERPGRDKLWARAAKIELLVLDVDGVLTDGFLYYGPDGEQLKKFDVKDGHALVLARHLGLPAAILSGRNSRAVETRAKELGLAVVLQGKQEKSSALFELLSGLAIPKESCAFMGDDLNDLGPMGLVGLSACPSDAVPEVKESAMFVAQSPGGRGAVRELVELCLKASGRWEKAVECMRTGQCQPRNVGVG